jgi:4-amino-4-deoxy-L-arabinose transferase-like glycosyltransferase
VSASIVEQSGERPQPAASAHGLSSRVAVDARLQAAAPFLLISAIALASRLKYALFTYHDTLASGDAHLILTKALLVSRGEWRPPVELGGPATIFSDPPFIALFLGAIEKVTSLPMMALPAIVTSALTIAALCALYGIARRAFDPLTALAGVCLVALLPRFSLDSTEPDKAIYVVSFFMIALYFLYEAQSRPRLYLAAGAFMGLSAFSHTTGYIFLGVYVLSHVALTRGSERRLADGWFLAGLAVPLVLIAGYVQLNDAFQRTSVTPTPAAAAPASVTPGTTPSDTQVVPAPAAKNKHRFVPGSIQLYYDNVTGLAERGFKGSAWNRYFDGIRTQVNTPVYALAVAGFAGAAIVVLRRRRYALLPLMLWMMLVTLAFAIQHPALSHKTRYPTYVTPAFVLFATYAVTGVARLVASKTDAATRGWYAAAAAAPVLALIAASYAISDASGQRKLYAPHDRLAQYVEQHQLLSDGNELLYMAWPSITINLIEDHPEYEPWLHTYGWGSSAAIGDYTRDYVQSRGIRYFELDHTGSDYYQTSQYLYAQLSTQFTMKRVATFCGTEPASQRTAASCGESYSALIELAAKDDAAP